MGELGIETYCWVWTELPVGVPRTSDAIPRRGGSLTTGYDHRDMEGAGPHPEAGITEEELWENLQYFLDEVVPVAEEAGVKLALHPDDPPISPVRGVPRLVTSLESYERILDMHPSPNHGVTFCQGNFAAMGEDVPEAIDRLADDIHFVHFRDVEGTADSFVETWQDEGPDRHARDDSGLRGGRLRRADSARPRAQNGRRGRPRRGPRGLHRHGPIVRRGLHERADGTGGRRNVIGRTSKLTVTPSLRCDNTIYTEGIFQGA